MKRLLAIAFALFAVSTAQAQQLTRAQLLTAMGIALAPNGAGRISATTVSGFLASVLASTPNYASDGNAANGFLKLDASGNANLGLGSSYQISGTNILPLTIAEFGADPTGVADSTTAWNNAVAAAATSGRELYCSTGTYKITGSIVTSTDNTKTVTIRGPGGKGCVIQPTFSTGKPVIKADLAALCWNTQTPCLTVKGLYFDTPAGAGASTTDVIEATNQQYIDFEDNVAVAYRRGLTLTTSYSPRIVHNFHYNSRGSFLIANADQTMNNAVIRENTITGSGITLSEPAFNVGPLSGQAVGMLFQSNNLNGNYGCWLVNGLVAANFFSNYCEASTVFSIISPPTSVPSTGLNFVGNVWSQNPDTNIQAITNSTFDYEDLFNNTFLFDAVNTVNVKAGQHILYAGASSFPIAAKTQTIQASTFTVGTPASYALSVGNGDLDIGLGTDASFGYLQSWNGKKLKLNGAGNNVLVGAGLEAPSLPTSAGTIKGTLCVDTTGVIYVKTTAGACL